MMLPLWIPFQLHQYLPKRTQRTFQILRNFFRQHIGVGQVFEVSEGFVFKPGDAGLVLILV